MKKEGSLQKKKIIFESKPNNQWLKKDKHDPRLNYMCRRGDTPCIAQGGSSG